MKRRLPALTSLLVLLLIVQSSCAAPTESPLQEPPTVTAGTQTTSDGPPAQIAVTETATAGTPPAEATATVTVTLQIEATRVVEQPPSLISPPDKPSLTIQDEQGLLAAASVTYGHTIGFIFPDGQVALKLAAVNNPHRVEEGLTVVGAIQMGPGAGRLEPGIYAIAIDLESTEGQVFGRLIRGESGQELMFARTPLIRNPARQDSPTFPAISPIIASDGVCFVVARAEVLGKAAQPEISWFRYCSLGAVGTGEALLSVRDNFPDQFESLLNSLSESQSRLEAADFPLPGEIDYGLTISEIEGHPSILACTEQNECAADITGAPTAGFWNDYDEARAAASGGAFAVTAAIVRVERPLEVPGLATVQPGDYWVRVWFDGQENFLGANLLGVADDGQVISGQTIPSTPAYFLDANDPRATVSWISAWRLRRWCMWQSNCP